MIAQLVFSVPVADPDAARDTVGSAYAKFSHTERTVWLSAGLSYLTLSQPADKALRATAIDSPTEPMADRIMYRTRGLATLVVWIVGLFTTTFLWLLRWNGVRTKWKRAS